MKSHPLSHATHYPPASGHGINYRTIPSEYGINQGNFYIPSLTAEYNVVFIYNILVSSLYSYIIFVYYV